MEPVLTVADIVSGYGPKRVVDGVSLVLKKGEVLTVIGHNGAGKSTLLKSIVGTVEINSGVVSVSNVPVPSPSPRRMLELGVAYVPQGNRVFNTLSVLENIEVGPVSRMPPSRQAGAIDRILELFPVLRPLLRQKAGKLSGGEKQVLALATVFAVGPKVLLLDEPTLGLSHAIASAVLKYVADVSDLGGAAVVLVEQKVRAAIEISDRVLVLRGGKVAHTGLASELKDVNRLKEVYL